MSSRPTKRLSSESSSDGTPAKRTATWDEPTGGQTSDDSNRMRVYVRVRPLNDREFANPHKNIDVIDNQMLVFDPVELDDNLETDDQYVYHGKTYRQIGRRPNKNLQFVFDRVFDESTENIQIYELSTKNFVQSLLNGYNCAVFAYGATGSGKTHTMLGSCDDPGVIFFTTMDLFRQIEAKAEEEKLELTISYFEIYNEMVYDLLGPTTGNSLAVREDARKGIVVQGLSVHQPTDASNLLEMLESGNRRRTQHPTDANSESSRSHAVFQISLKKQDFSSSQEMSIQVSKMSLIDLAGSERATTAYKTSRNKSLQREGGNINKSLLALGNCITALAQNDPKKKSTYIPYRGSKLTLLLRDSLGGNCQTAMIATVSPSGHHYEETHNTLVYADRAKGIQLNFKKNNFSVGLQPRNYGHMMESQNKKIVELTEENKRLRQENEKLKNQMESIPDNAIEAKTDSLQKLNAVKKSLDLLFEERLELRRQLIECESNLKKIDLKLFFRKYDVENQRLMAPMDDDMDSAPKSDPLQALYNQKLHYSSQKSELDVKVEENENKIRRIEEKLIEQCGDDDWVINNYFAINNIKAENQDRAAAEKHTLEMAKEILCHSDGNRELFTEAVQLNRQAYSCLDGMGRLSEEMERAFLSHFRKAEGKKNVAWKDDISSPKISKRKEVENMLVVPKYSAQSPGTPLANTSRNLVSVHDITPYQINLNDTFEAKTPLSQRNLNLSRLSLTSSVHKPASKVGIVTPTTKFPKRSAQDDDENNVLNDTFTIEANRKYPSPASRHNYNSYNSPNGGQYGRAQSDKYYNRNQYNRGSAQKTWSPYASSNNRQYSNNWNRNPNYKYRKPWNQPSRPYGHQNESQKSPNYPRFRF